MKKANKSKQTKYKGTETKSHQQKNTKTEFHEVISGFFFK